MANKGRFYRVEHISGSRPDVSCAGVHRHTKVYSHVSEESVARLRNALRATGAKFTQYRIHWMAHEGQRARSRTVTDHGLGIQVAYDSGKWKRPVFHRQYDESTVQYIYSRTAESHHARLVRRAESGLVVVLDSWAE